MAAFLLRWLFVLTVVVSSVLDLGAVRPAAAQAAVVAYVNTPLLNIRSGPGANHTIVDQVDKGQDMVVLGRSFDSAWLQVNVPGSGQGWASAYYLQVSGSVAGLPVADTSTQQPKAYSITGLNLRAGPGYSFPVLSRVPRHADLVLLAQNINGLWAQVRRPDGQEGWVDVKYLKTSTAVAGLPVSDRQYGAPTVTPVPGAPPPAVFANWRGEYFANRDLAGAPAFVRDDPAIDFTWWGNPALPGLPADDFSVRWTRQLPFDAGTYRFRVTADDGVRLWVGDRLLIDDWREGQTTRTAEINLAVGPQTVRLEYFERGGEALARLAWERVDAYPDWKGEYWNNAALSGAPVIVRNDAALDFAWGQTAPDPRLPADNFSARWTRSLNLEAGTYRFRVLVDDGARLWVDDRLVIDEWRGGASREVTGEVSLSAGAHSLKLEYYDAAVEARARLTWERSGPQTFSDWKGEYWANATLSGTPAVVRNETRLDFVWGLGAPAANLPGNQFSARWTRTQTFEAGTYTLYAQADDGVRWYVDGQLVLDQWHDSDSGLYSAELTLDAGPHALQVEYYENQYTAQFRAWWTRR